MDVATTEEVRGFLLANLPLGPSDEEPIGAAGDVRWWNFARFARADLVAEGLMLEIGDSGRGVWELTSAGSAHADALLQGARGDAR